MNKQLSYVLHVLETIGLVLALRITFSATRIDKKTFLLTLQTGEKIRTCCCLLTPIIKQLLLKEKHLKEVRP